MEYNTLQENREIHTRCLKKYMLIPKTLSKHVSLDLIATAIFRHGGITSLQTTSLGAYCV